MAHFDPVSGELVACETTYTGPISWAENLKRLMANMPLEEIARKLGKSEIELRSTLYLLECSKNERIGFLIDEFLNQFDLAKEKKGKAKAIAYEIINELTKD